MEPRAGADRRHRAREAALQMLYQWEVGGEDLDEVLASYRLVGPHALDDEAEAMARRLVRGTALHLAQIDPLIGERAEHWRLERMPVIDRIVLRLALYEFLHEPSTPRAVVINEAIELARTFSTEAAVKFINGVLDAIHRRLLEQELPPSG
jgi:transcription antitermination protein NusB